MTFALAVMQQICETIRSLLVDVIGGLVVIIIAERFEENR